MSPFGVFLNVFGGKEKMLFRNKAGNVYKRAYTTADELKFEAQGMIKVEEAPKNTQKSAENQIETKSNDTPKPKPKTAQNTKKAVKPNENGNKNKSK